MNSLSPRVALITGAAKRIGATIARRLHARGMNLVLHYRASAEAAQALCSELEAQRADSVLLLPGDLSEVAGLPALVEKAVARWQRLDVLVNNASSFYPTPLGQITEQDWENLLGSNVKGPFFLCQAATPYLQAQQGCIVNLVDIHAQRPMPGYPVYSIAKAGMAMLTQSLAWELAPTVRVNGIAPGAILWPESGDSDKQRIMERIPLQRAGSPDDIARTVVFLIEEAGYVSGQILAVDGGRSLNM